MAPKCGRTCSSELARCMMAEGLCLQKQEEKYHEKKDHDMLWDGPRRDIGMGI